MCSDRRCCRRSNHNFSKTNYMDVDNDNSGTSSRGYISITPQMIRTAVKRLHLRRVYVNSNLISEYLRHNYPVDSNIKTFQEELNKKLDCAVYVGLIMKHGENAYYLPTLRQEANRLKTAFAEFWEIIINSALHKIKLKEIKDVLLPKRIEKNMVKYLEYNDIVVKLQKLS